ncbi:MAG: EF-hand domain-containing protein [Kofleriaceae bacterium]|nr:EF-hand domain-containing protein [Kofleriaceae bacterium]
MPGSTRREREHEPPESEAKKFVSTREHEPQEATSESQKEWFSVRRSAPAEHDVPAGEGSASQPAEDDEDTKELKQKVSTLVTKRFGGDYKKAFAHYDANGDGAIDKSELVGLLSEAGVGNSLTRGTWASRIIERLDTSGDLKVQWAEFDKVFRARD